MKKKESTLIRHPGNIDISLLKRVNKVRDANGITWTFLMDRLLKLFIKKGTSLWEK